VVRIGIVSSHDPIPSVPGGIGDARYYGIDVSRLAHITSCCPDPISSDLSGTCGVGDVRCCGTLLLSHLKGMFRRNSDSSDHVDGAHEPQAALSIFHFHFSKFNCNVSLSPLLGCQDDYLPISSTDADADVTQ
jgi:hypothetical protein